MSKAYWISLVVAIGFPLIYIFGSCYLDLMCVLSGILTVSLSTATIATSFFSLRKYWDGFGSKLTRVWLNFTIGLILWFLGTLMLMVYYLLFGVETAPVLSIADVFYLIGYPPLFIALISYLSLVKPAISKGILATACTTVFAGSVVSSFFFIIPAAIEDADVLAKIVNVAYPMLDLFLYMLSVLGLLVFKTTSLKGRVDKAWMLLNVGFLMYALGDSWISYAIAKGTYYYGHPVELFFQFGYLLLILAFYIHAREL